MGVIVVFAMVASAMAIGAQANRPAREKAMIDAEHKVLEAIAKGDLGAFKALVSNEGWSVDPSGVMSVKEFEKNFKQFKIEPGWKISDTRVIWAASNTAILTYKWTGKGTFMGQPLPEVVFASTVWHEADKRWVAMFHQETPAK